MEVLVIALLLSFLTGFSGDFDFVVLGDALLG